LIPLAQPRLKRKITARKTTFQTPVSKRMASSKQSPKWGPSEKEVEEPKSKKAKTSTLLSPNLAKFLQRSVVRGNIVTVAYFKEQELKVFLEKLRTQGWLELFTNTQLGCSIPELAEFYARCSVTEGIVTSEVNGVRIEFDAEKLGDILGVPAAGFEIYVCEDKSLLGKARLL